ncbi:MAG: RNA polymerase sigma factor [Bacteroidota bacterium]
MTTILRKPGDIELIGKVKAGNQLAFRMLVERYEQQVRRTVLGMLGQVPEADEVAQDVFIRFYRSIENFKGEAKLGTYLTRIAINLSINALKKRQQKNKRWLSIFQREEQVIQLPDPSADPVRFETSELINKAIQKLEPEFRAVVILRLVEGYSVKETAEMLQLPQGTVASRLSRAQLRLKAMLQTILK